MARIEIAGGLDNTLVRFNAYGAGISADFIGRDGKPAGASLALLGGGQPASKTPMYVNQDRLIQKMRDLPTAYPKSWQFLYNAHLQTVWNGKRDPRQVGKPEKTYPPRRADALQQTAQLDNFDFISDYYSLPYSGLPAPNLLQKSDAEKHLSQLAAEQDSSWKQSGGIFLVRHNRWYREDRTELTEEEAASLSKQYKKVETDRHDSLSLSFSLPRLVTLVKSVSFWKQLNGLTWLTPKLSSEERRKQRDKNGSYSPPFYRDAEKIVNSYSLLSFLAELPEDAVRLLSKGKLPVSALPESLRVRAQAVAPELLFLPESGLEQALLKVDWSEDFMQRLSLKLIAPESAP